VRHVRGILGRGGVILSLIKRISVTSTACKSENERVETIALKVKLRAKKTPTFTTAQARHSGD